MIGTQGSTGAVTALGLSGLRGIWKSKLVWVAVGFSAVHIGIRAAIIVFTSTLFPSAIDQILTPSFLRDMVALQATLPVVIVLGTVGARVTARDRMMGGLEFVLSKAIPRWGYVAGRALAPTLAAFLLVLLPAIVLAGLIALMVDPLPAGAGDDLWGAIGLAALVTFVLGALAAGLGTLVDNPRSATAIWLATVWATLPVAAFLREMRVDWWWATSPIETLVETGATLMDIRFPGGEPSLGWLASFLLFVIPLGLLYYRTTEVYG